MPYADNLPPELNAIETQLRGLLIPAAQLDRDETLYRSGWAAAEAQRQRTSGRGWLWPATSAMLAASVAVLSLLMVESNRSDAPTVAHTALSPADEQLDNQPPIAVVTSRTHSSTKPIFACRFSPEDNSLLAVRERALRGVIKDPTRSMNEGEITIRDPKTNRELLDELLARSNDS